MGARKRICARAGSRWVAGGLNRDRNPTVRCGAWRASRRGDATAQSRDRPFPASAASADPPSPSSSSSPATQLFSIFPSGSVVEGCQCATVSHTYSGLKARPADPSPPPASPTSRRRPRDPRILVAERRSITLHSTLADARALRHPRTSRWLSEILLGPKICAEELEMREWCEDPAAYPMPSS